MFKERAEMWNGRQLSLSPPPGCLVRKNTEQNDRNPAKHSKREGVKRKEEESTASLFVGL